jgi:DNA-binding response OmpR family regulator
MTILVVEDDPAVLMLVDRMLTLGGHTVLAAEDADQARFMLADHGSSPDVLVVDIILPGSNGLDFAREAKSAHPAVKILFMTGLLHQSPKALRSGLGPVLHKPFTSEALLKAISRL